MIRNGFVYESTNGSWISLDLVKSFECSLIPDEKMKCRYKVVARIKVEGNELGDEVIIEDLFRSLDDAQTYLISNGFMYESTNGSWISLDLVKSFECSFEPNTKNEHCAVIAKFKVEDKELGDEITIENSFRSLDDAQTYLNAMLLSNLKTDYVRGVRYGFACICFDDDDDDDSWTWVDIREIEKKYITKKIICRNILSHSDVFLRGKK